MHCNRPVAVMRNARFAHPLPWTSLVTLHPLPLSRSCWRWRGRALALHAPSLPGVLLCVVVVALLLLLLRLNLHAADCELLVFRVQCSAMHLQVRISCCVEQWQAGR
jgi:hypothetical protein